MKLRIVGAGSWGTALAQVAADNGHDVVIYGRDRSAAEEINTLHTNSRYFETELNHAVLASDDIGIVKDADIILLAVPSRALEDVIAQIVPYLDHKTVFVNVAKGFHPVTHERLYEVILRSVPEAFLQAVVSLIGPSHAEEVVARLLTAVNAVSDDLSSAKLVQQVFSNDVFRVYTGDDVIGAEIGCAVKNILAIASGILSGIGQGDNARAALMTRGLAEMTRFGMAKGGRMDTFLGLDGVGDLIVTCSSRHSRNFMAGYQIGRDDSAEKFLRENTKTVEGIGACAIVYEEAEKMGIEMPITEQIHHVLFEGGIPSESIMALMHRDLKREEVVTHEAEE
ncbi:MAG: NAD(P)-dependent glycerol-3-phosphate dehydrogenase [Solobacterium sp.]|nr:NAD(P)-dependent glycerol-3-phosphate dehydrogenase [Solobacterium sp.]